MFLNLVGLYAILRNPFLCVDVLTLLPLKLEMSVDLMG